MDESKGWGIAFKCRCGEPHADWIPFSMQHPATPPDPWLTCDMCRADFPSPVAYRHMTFDEFDDLMGILYRNESK